ncbi:interferon-induced protein 44-like [Cyprinodon tularosa]|uniref:interferon-induced protein 44-like n=1 Tax=Cyprinodon tularosa TaxID=77115 RepID=UPI0018E24856|nr:interferon-induced protein 44-like [Cyprinodon tularosa]
MDWGNRETDLQFIDNYRPTADGQQQFRILLHGPIGAGKSSFINSVTSVLTGKISVRADAASSQTSHTKKYTTYSIEKGDQGQMYPFVLNDMSGLESADRRVRRVHVKDVKKAMKGCIKDGYIFNPQSSLSKDDRFYNKKPNVNDKVHIVVTVIDAQTASIIPDNTVEIIQEIRDEAADLGIPHMVIFAKTDKACPEIKKDLAKMFCSRILHEQIQKFSKLVGFPENCIFPIKNYHSETTLKNDIDALLLKTLRRIIEIAEEQLKNKNRTQT